MLRGVPIWMRSKRTRVEEMRRMEKRRTRSKEKRLGWWFGSRSSDCNDNLTALGFGSALHEVEMSSLTAREERGARWGLPALCISL
jgi:hypothetical protein